MRCGPAYCDSPGALFYRSDNLKKSGQKISGPGKRSKSIPDPAGDRAARHISLAVDIVCPLFDDPFLGPATVSPGSLGL